MRRFLLSITKGAFLGGVVGVLALAILTGGSGDSLQAGALLGASLGALLGLCIWARGGESASLNRGYAESLPGYGAYDSGLHSGDIFDGGGFDGGGMDAGGFDGGGF